MIDLPRYLPFEIGWEYNYGVGDFFNDLIDGFKSYFDAKYKHVVEPRIN